MAKDIEEKLEEALDNIRQDRAIAKKLLQPIVLLVEKNNKQVELQRALGQVANKYIENIQKSNDQLIKLVSMMQKIKDDDSFMGFTAEENKQLFDYLDNQGKKEEMGE